MKRNERELLLLVNGDFFWNVRECIIPRCSLVTVHIQKCILIGNKWLCIRSANTIKTNS